MSNTEPAASAASSSPQPTPNNPNARTVPSSLNDPKARTVSSDKSAGDSNTPADTTAADTMLAATTSADATSANATSADALPTAHQPPYAQRLYRTATRGEAAAGIAWLCLGAIISMFLEVIYLGTWMFGVAVPYTIPIAFFFNMVLTRTALLWTKNPYIALIPLWVWLAGIVLIALTFSFTGDQLIGSNIRSILLMVAGALGGSWPLFVKK